MCFGDKMSDYFSVEPKYLLSHLSKLNPNHKISAYFAEFDNLNTTSDRVNFVYKDLHKYKLFPKLKSIGKDDSVAETYRKEAFSFNDYNVAVKCAKSPNELALAYGARSRILFKNRRFKECITSIDRAIANGYPKDKASELILQREKAQNLINRLEPPKRYYENIPVIPKSRRHSEIPCAKNCITIEGNGESKRVIAVKDIDIGEVLSVEAPFTTYLENRDELCDTCLDFCLDILPCDNCSLVMFCSNACKDEACNSYHKHECSIPQNFWRYIEEESFVFLALRLAIIALQAEKLGPPSKYLKIQELPVITEKLSTDQLFEFAISAAFIYYVLDEYTTLFKEHTDRDALKELIFRQVEISFWHQTEISALGKYSNSETVGFGIYSFTSLFRHSCCSNVERIQYGGKLVLRAVNTIKKGQECSVSYGVTYKDQRRRERQLHILRTRFHVCNCEACDNNWPKWSPLFKPPLHVDLDMEEWELDNMKKKLNRKDVSAARHHLPNIIQKLRRYEKFEPFGNAFEIKALVSLSYKIFGNKTLVWDGFWNSDRFEFTEKSDSDDSVAFYWTSDSD